MVRRSRINLRLQSLVLLALIPCLLVTTALFGTAVYRAIHGIILTGFDQKLHAVSTVTGAFIDGDDHERLIRSRDIIALTPWEVNGEPELLGAERASGRLHRIDLEQGGGLAADSLPAGTIALASDPESGTLWAATAEPALYRSNAPADGFERIAGLGDPPAGLAFDPAEDVLYAGGERLLALDPASGDARAVGVTGVTGPVRAPALDPSARTLYLLGGETASLIAVDLRTGAGRAIGDLHLGDGGESPTRAAPPPRVSDLTFASGSLFGAADRLVRVDAATAALESGTAIAGFRSERSEEYQRYLPPMRRVMARNDITYLYTETVEMGGLLTYWIDASTGEDHSIIGTTEVIADDEIGAMERAMVEGSVRLSALEDWGDWGLLKTADAPIFDRDGRVVALAAADVDISVILDKTRLALVKVGAVATVMLLLGALVSLYISRRLVAPLMEVQEGALQLATGRFGHRIADQNLIELRELASSFNDMSEALGTTVSELSRTNAELESVRGRQALVAALLDPPLQPPPDPTIIVLEPRTAEGPKPSPSGWVGGPGMPARVVFAWMIEPEPGAPLADLKLRHEIAALAEPLVAQHPNDPERVAATLAKIFPRIECLIRVDAALRTIRLAGRRPARVAIGSGQQPESAAERPLGRDFTLAPHEWAVISADDPVRTAANIMTSRAGDPTAGLVACSKPTICLLPTAAHIAGTRDAGAGAPMPVTG